MRKSAPWLLALCCALITVKAAAFTTEQHQSVIRLGELNGIALQCGYTADMRRMKQALVEAVPKVSQLGELFEDTTHKSFLAMVEKKQTCPNLAPFHADVDSAIGALRQAFEPTQP